MGLARAVLVMLEAGFGAEAAAEVRMLHEATRLLGAPADEAEPDLLRRWLEDADEHWVRPREARAAADRQRERVIEILPQAKEAAEAAGELERAAQLAEAIREASMEQELAKMNLQIYDVLSRIGHSRRSGIREAVSTNLREMVTGPHPDPLMQAQYVEWASHIMEEVVLAVCDALAPFFPRGNVVKQMRVLVRRLETVRREAPLDAAARAAIAGR